MQNRCSPSASSLLTRRRLLLAILVIFAAIVLVKGVYPALLSAQGDFANYYTAAKLLSQGESIEWAYRDFLWFQKQIDQYGIENQVGGFIPHPPPTALVFLPLTPFEPLTAKRIWTLSNVALLVLCIALLAKISGLDWVVAGLILLGCGGALINNFLFGQLYLLLLASILLALYFERSGSPVVAGICLGSLLPVKYVGGLWLLYFSFRRRWKLMAGAVLTVSTVMALSLWLDGPGSMLVFVRQVLPRHLNGEIQDPFSLRLQSWNSLFRRLFLYEETLNPVPLVDEPLLFFLSKNLVFWSVAVVAVVVFLKVNLGDKTHRRLFRMGLIPVVTLLLSPAGATYHFLLLSISVSFFLKILLDHGRTREGILLVLLHIGINLPHYLWLETLAKGWLTPLGYSRLWLLLLLFLFILWIFRTQIDWLRPAGPLSLLLLGTTLFSCLEAYSRYPSGSGDRARWLEVTSPEFDHHLGLILKSPDMGRRDLVFSYCELLENHYAVYGRDGLRKTVRSQENYYDPDLFDDDTSLLVETVRQGKNEIWAADRLGKRWYVTAGENPSWGPNGHQFAFIRDGQLFIRNFGAGNPTDKPLQTSRNCYDVAYSPRGTHLAYCVKNRRGSSLMVLDLERGTKRTILTSDTILAGPAWSSNQRNMLFSWEVDGNRDIYALGLGKPQGPVRITTHPARDSDPIWDGEGKRIIFTSDRGRGLEFSTLYWIPVPEALK